MGRFSTAVMALCVLTLDCGSSSTSPATPHSAVGKWAGTLQARNTIVSTNSGPTLTIALTVAEAGPIFAGTCADGTSMQAFGTFSTSSLAPNQVGFRGNCDGLLFQFVYDPAADRLIDVVYRAGDYIDGELERVS